MPASVDELISGYSDEDSKVVFDRAQLQSTCLNTSTGTPMCSEGNEVLLLRYLILGAAAINCPYSFLEATHEVKEKSRCAQQVKLLVKELEQFHSAESGSSGGAPSSSYEKPDEEELEGMLRYYSAKVNKPLPPHLYRIMAPLCYAMGKSGSWDYGLLFTVLHRVVESWVPALAHFSPCFVELSRLLLQYHDAELCMHLEQHNISVGTHLLPWIRSLLTASKEEPQPQQQGLKKGDEESEANASSSSAAAPIRSPKETLLLWEWLFAYDLKDLLFYVCLAFMMEQRSLLMKITTKEGLDAALSSFQFSSCTPNSGVKEILLQAKLLHKQTPTAARSAIHQYITSDSDPESKNGSFNAGVGAGSNNSGDAKAEPPSPTAATTPVSSSASRSLTLSPKEQAERYRSFVALPIESQELVNTFAAHEPGQSRPSYLKYVVLDCRAENSFNYARLPTAMHVGDTIGFDPELLQKMVGKFKDIKGSHLAILGTGKELTEEANLLKIIALQFIQAGFPHIGIVEDGFKGCIPFIKAGKIEFVRSTPTPKKKPAVTESSSSNSSGAERHHHHQDPNEHHPDKLKEAAEQTKEKLASAKSWGMGMMKSLAAKTQTTWSAAKATYQEKQGHADDTTGVTAANNTNTGTGSKKAGQQAKEEQQPMQSGWEWANSNKSNASKTGTKKATEQQQKQRGKERSPSPMARPPQQQNLSEPVSAYSFGAEEEDDDDDDLGLITSVKPKGEAAPPVTETKTEEEECSPSPEPMTAKKEEEVPSKQAEEQPAAAASTSATAATTKTEAAPHPFDEIFGDDF